MSLFVRTKTLRTKASFADDGQTASIKITGLPDVATDPAKFLSFVLKSDAPSGSSPTIDVTIEISHDNSTWIKEGC